eukprot:352597-Chlamydomonas_euryale.AAC.4
MRLRERAGQRGTEPERDLFKGGFGAGTEAVMDGESDNTVRADVRQRGTDPERDSGQRQIGMAQRDREGGTLSQAPAGSL